MRLSLTATLLAFALPALSACGESGSDGRSADEVDRAFARFSSQEVADHFQRATGVELERERSPTGLETLRTPAALASTPVLTRYGIFTIYVTDSKRSLEVITDGEDKPLKVIANVVIDGTSGSPESARGLQRTVRIFESLGKPAQEQAALPSEERPCRDVGIDPEGGDKEGVCKLGQQTLRIVNANGKLDPKGKRISRLRMKTGQAIILRRPRVQTQRVRSRGGLVAVTLRLENTGAEPLNNFRPNLVVDGQRYTPDDSKANYLQPDVRFPIQPGAFETVALVFDVPARTARRAERDGALEVAQDGTSPEFSTSVQRIRLPRSGSLRTDGSVR